MEYIISTSQLVSYDKISYPNIKIPKNLVSFISGPSGCGKSSFFKMLNATLSPTSGLIYYNNTNIDELNKIALRKDIVLVSQNPYLFNGTIQDNFIKFHQYHHSECQNDQQIKSFLDICCLDNDIVTQSMSGGEKQRVYLSIALSLGCKVLLLDEPTSALNYDLAIKVLTNIINYTKSNDITLVIISHDLTIQKLFAENVISLGV